MDKFVINSVGIIGGGSWGSAIAKLFANNLKRVLLWDRKSELINEINKFHTNTKYLPEIKLPQNILAIENLNALKDCDVIALAIPAQSIRMVLNQLKVSHKTLFLICAKGIENSTLKLLSQVIEEKFSNEIAVLSGPNFAHEIAEDLPAASLVACKDLNIAKTIAQNLKSPNFRCYTGNDPIGTQIAGSVKNVIAIAVGICEGLSLGENAKAALITKGLNEIKLLNEKMNGDHSTIYGIAGMGDLILTCNSTTSRNMKLGYLIAQEGNAENILKDNVKVVEGYETAKAVFQLAKKHLIELPICEAVYSILYENKSIEDSIKTLMKRPIS